MLIEQDGSSLKVRGHSSPLHRIKPQSAQRDNSDLHLLNNRHKSELPRIGFSGPGQGIGFGMHQAGDPAPSWDPIYPPHILPTLSPALLHFLLIHSRPFCPSLAPVLLREALTFFGTRSLLLLCQWDGAGGLPTSAPHCSAVTMHFIAC